MILGHCERHALLHMAPKWCDHWTTRAGLTAVYTAVYTRIRVHCRYKAVYAQHTRPCTWPVHSRIHGPCTRPVHGSVKMFVYTGRVHGRVHDRVHGRVHGPSCTWQVGLPGHVHVPRRRATAVCGPSRPCTRPVHSSFTAVYTAVYDSRYTAVRHVHTSTPQLKGRVRAMYTSVYTGRTRHVAAVGHVHGRKAPCTRSCTRPIHSRVHVRLHGPCTRRHTRTVCRNGTRTAVVCRLGTCTLSGR